MRWETKKALRREIEKTKVIARHVAEQLEDQVQQNSLLEAEVSMLREEYRMKSKMLVDMKESLILSEESRQKIQKELDELRKPKITEPEWVKVEE